MFCNPPYGRHIQDWVRKGYEESQKPDTLVVMLIPARTDTSYFHDYIFGGKAAEVRFLRGRIKFTDEDGNAKDSAPFPSAVIVWRSHDTALSVRDMVLELIKGKAMTANEIAAELADRGQKVSRSDVGPILTKAQAAADRQASGSEKPEEPAGRETDPRPGLRPGHRRSVRSRRTDCGRPANDRRPRGKYERENRAGIKEGG